MKIEGPKSSSDINKKKGAKKTASGDGAFKSMMDDAGGAGKAKRQAKQRADTILDKLNDLKVAMVSGNITLGHMISIADVVASHRDNITDPELTAILDEIDLRAHVELAKLEVAKANF